MGNLKENSYEQQLNTFKEEKMKEAEDIVFNIFPKTIIELNELLKSDKFNLKNLKKYQEETKDGTLNELVHEIINISQSKVCKFIQDLKLLEIWISFLTPKIEDGNNFGVSVQEDIYNQITRVENNVFDYFRKTREYYGTRAKFVTKIAKYPDSKDYKKLVVAWEEESFFSIRSFLYDLRNYHTVIHDKILKNLDKIRRPRNSNTDTMY